jgi:hypothetical protein
MSKLPKLKIKKHFGGWPLQEKTCDLEQAGDILSRCWPGPDWIGVLVTVEGQLVNSYEELVCLSIQACYRDREFLEVGLYPQAGGG